MQYDITSKIIVEKGKFAIVRHFQKREPASITLLEALPQEQPSLKKGDYLFKVTDQQGQEEIQIWEFKTNWKRQDILSLMDYTLWRSCLLFTSSTMMFLLKNTRQPVNL